MPDTADYWASYCFIDDWIPFPNGQDLRLADLSSDNVFVRLVQVIYAAIVLAALICLSTCLIKQHSVLDVFAAVVL